MADAAEAYAASCKALDAFSLKRTPLTMSANGQTLVLTGFEKALIVEVVRAQNERLRDELVTALQSQLTPETPKDKG